MSYTIALRTLIDLTSSSDPHKQEDAVAMIKQGDDVDYSTEDEAVNALLQAAIKSEAFGVVQAVLERTKFSPLKKYRKSVAVAMRSPNADKLLALFFGYCELNVVECCRGLPWTVMSDDLFAMVVETLLQLNRLTRKPEIEEILECILSRHRQVVYRLFRATNADDRLIYLRVLLNWGFVLGDPAMVAFLIRSGMDVDDRANHEGECPLHLACKYDKPETVLLLLQLGADVNVTDRHGKTPFSMSFFDPERSNYGKTVKPMVKHFARLTSAGNETNREDMSVIQNNLSLRRSYGQCIEELERMKTLDAADGFPYFSIFSKTCYELSMLMRDIKFFNQLKGNLLPCKPERFPVFKAEMVAKFGIARQMKNIVVPTKRELEEVFYGILPSLVIDKIASCTRDLKNFEREYHLNRFGQK